MASRNKIMRVLVRGLVAVSCAIPDLVIWLLVLLVRLFYGGTLVWSGGLWCVLSDKKYSAAVTRVLGHGGWYVQATSRDPRRRRMGAARMFRETVFTYEIICVHLIVLLCSATLCVVCLPDFKLRIACVMAALVAVGPLFHRVAARIHGVLRQSVRNTPEARTDHSYIIAEKYMREKLGVR